MKNTARILSCNQWTLTESIGSQVDTVIVDTESVSGGISAALELAIFNMKLGGTLFAVCQQDKHHKYAAEIEDRGLDIRDCIYLINTSNHDESRSVVVAGKQYEKTFFNNAVKHGVAGFWIDGNRIGNKPSGWNGLTASGNTWNKDNCGLRKTGQPSRTVGKYPSNVVFYGQTDGFVADFFDVLPNKRAGNLFDFLCRLSKTPDGGSVMSIPSNDAVMAAAHASGRDFIGIVSKNDE